MPIKDPEARRTYFREYRRRRRAQARQAVQPEAVQPKAVQPVQPKAVQPVQPKAASPALLPAITKQQARKIRDAMHRPEETEAAREGFRERFAEIAAKNGLTPEQLELQL